MAQWKGKDAHEEVESDDESEEPVDSIPEKKKRGGFMSRLQAQDKSRGTDCLFGS